MKNHLYINANVVDGELKFKSKFAENRFKKFFKSFPDDSRVEIFVSANDKKGALTQLAKVHASIRELASDLGYTFKEMKLQVKRRTGLCFVKDNAEYIKSFADCDHEELNLAIQACIELGDFNGLNLR